MRRRFKLVAALVLLAAAVGVGAYLLLAPDADLAAAAAAAARRDFRGAAGHLDRYLLRRPGDPGARLLAARAARRGGDFEAAAAHLRVLAQRPGGTDPALVLENRLLSAQKGSVVEINSLMAAHAGGADAAFVAEAAAVGVLRALDPNPGPRLTPEADAAPLLATGRRAAELWLGLRPGREDRAAGLVWRGRMRYLGGDQPGALADLREALELDPRSLDARFHLALVVAHSSPQEAVAHLAVLRDRRPDDPRVRFGAATTYRALGRLDEAAKILDEMLADNPDDVQALTERGNVAVDAGRAAEAEALLLRARKLAPKDRQVPLALSRCMRAAGRPDKVKEYLDLFRQLAAEQGVPTGQ
jgi:tetratricopeptide (TPR) repeat protein